MSGIIAAQERVSWRRYVGYSLLACLVSAILAALRPIWIAPPLIQFTTILYVALAWAGVITLALASRYHPVGKGWLFLGISLNLVYALITSVIVISVMVLVGPKACDAVSTGTIFVHYDCSWTFFYTGYGLDLYGLPYLPLMVGISSGSTVTSSFG